MVELDPEELAMLKRAKKGRMQITFRDRGMSIPTGSAERHVAERLVRRGHLQFLGLDDDRTGMESALYQITPHGRIVLDLVAGRVKLDPEDASHPGCC